MIFLNPIRLIILFDCNQLSNEYFIRLSGRSDANNTTRVYAEEKFRSSRVESMENTIHFINFSSCPRAKRRITRICRSNKFSGGRKKECGRSNKSNHFIFFFFCQEVKLLSESSGLYFLSARFIFMTCLSRPTANKPCYRIKSQNVEYARKKL